MGLAAYKSTIRHSEDPRQIERRVLSRITHDIAIQAESFDAADTRMERLAILAGGLRETLYENQRFWSALRHDLAEPGNAMPAQLKAGLISIALWVDRQTTLLLSGEGRLRTLVDINGNIAAGLAGQTGATTAEA